MPLRIEEWAAKNFDPKESRQMDFAGPLIGTRLFLSSHTYRRSQGVLLSLLDLKAFSLFQIY